MNRILGKAEISRKEWDDLILKSSCSSWFQSYDAYAFFSSFSWLEAFVFGVKSDERLAGIIVGYIQKDGGRIKQFLSRRAIINGGALLSDDITDEALSLLLSHCKQSLRGKAIYIECRNFEDFSSHRLVFESSGFKYIPHLNFHVDTSSEEVVEQNLGKGRRRDIKTSLRDGAEIVDNPTVEEVRQFYSILDDLYKNKVKTPLYPLDFFEHLHKQAYSRFLLVRYEGRIVGGTVCVCLEGHAVYEWFACGLDNVAKTIYPSTLATYAGIRYAAQNGFGCFDMMGAGKPDEEYGVRDFKAKFGGKLVEYGRFLCVLNPFLYEIGKAGVKIMKKMH